MNKSFRINLLLVVVLTLSPDSWGQRVLGTNTAYQEGDWVSFSQSRFIRSIQVTHDLVYAATEGGILRYDYLSDSWLFPFTVSNGLPENNIHVAAYDIRTNQLWCATPTAIAAYNRTSRIWENVYLDQLNLDPDDPIVSIGFSFRGTWLSSREGRFYFSSGLLTHFSRARPQGDEAIEWVGERGRTPVEMQPFYFDNSMLFVDNASDYWVQDQNMRNFTLAYIKVDPWQTLWAGSAGLGLFSANLNTGRMVHHPFGLLSRDVRAIFKTESQVWLGGGPTGSTVEGITLWERDVNRWSYFEPQLIMRFGGREVWDIEAGKNELWFGTNSGLVRYRQQQDRWKTFTEFDNLLDNRVYSLAWDGVALWAGSHDGLDRIEFVGQSDDSMEVSHITPWRDQTTIYDILVDGDMVWAGTALGLMFYDKAVQQTGYYRGSGGPGREVIPAVERSGDSLWVATLGGIEVYDLVNREWLGPPERREFDTYVNDVATTKGVVWIGTDRGLYRFDKRQRKWRYFSTEDGLLDPSVQDIETDGDFLLIGSPQGLTRFYWNSNLRLD